MSNWLSSAAPRHWFIDSAMFPPWMHRSHACCFSMFSGPGCSPKKHTRNTIFSNRNPIVSKNHFHDPWHPFMLLGPFFKTWQKICAAKKLPGRTPSRSPCWWWVSLQAIPYPNLSRTITVEKNVARFGWWLAGLGVVGRVLCVFFCGGEMFLAGIL